MKITSATVAFKRTVQPAQYESKSVELSLAIVPDSEDDFLQDAEIAQALDKAESFVFGKLGIRKAPAETKAANPTTSFAGIPGGVSSPTADATKAAEEKRKPGRPPGTTKEAMAAKKPAEAAPTTTASAPAPSAPVADEPNFLDEEAPAVAYTAVDVQKAIGLKVKEKGNAVGPTIVAMIKEYDPDSSVVKTPNQILAAVTDAVRATIMGRLEKM